MQEKKLNIAEHAKNAAIAFLGYWIIRIVGSTLRWNVINWDILDSVYCSGKRLILAFWHGRIFMASYYFRNRGIVVMTSQNRDGEYIARVIRRFGYGVARGSSSRGSHSAIIETLHALKEGKDIGFTIDGPRGPRYIAKPGAVYMAWKSGNPIIPFNVSAEKKWVMQSWDHFQVPKPFSRAILLIGNPIYVDKSTSKENLGIYEKRVQLALDELRERGDHWWEGLGDR
jgi:lysophospholipid acyltransferase (LPLAT)-like uncharacterized protein